MITRESYQHSRKRRDTAFRQQQPMTGALKRGKLSLYNMQGLCPTTTTTDKAIQYRQAPVLQTAGTAQLLPLPLLLQSTTDKAPHPLTLLHLPRALSQHPPMFPATSRWQHHAFNPVKHLLPTQRALPSCLPCRCSCSQHLTAAVAHSQVLAGQQHSAARLRQAQQAVAELLVQQLQLCQLLEHHSRLAKRCCLVLRLMLSRVHLLCAAAPEGMQSAGLLAVSVICAGVVHWIAAAAERRVYGSAGVCSTCWRV